MDFCLKVLDYLSNPSLPYRSEAAVAVAVKKPKTPGNNYNYDSGYN